MLEISDDLLLSAKIRWNSSISQYLIPENVGGEIKVPFPGHNHILEEMTKVSPNQLIYFLKYTLWSNYSPKYGGCLMWKYIKIQAQTVKWEHLLANFNSGKQNTLVLVSQHWIFLFPLPSKKCSNQLQPIFANIQTTAQTSLPPLRILQSSLLFKATNEASERLYHRTNL